MIKYKMQENETKKNIKRLNLASNLYLCRCPQYYNAFKIISNGKLTNIYVINSNIYVINS